MQLITVCIKYGIKRANSRLTKHFNRFELVCSAKKSVCHRSLKLMKIIPNYPISIY